MTLRSSNTVCFSECSKRRSRANQSEARIGTRFRERLCWIRTLDRDRRFEAFMDRRRFVVILQGFLVKSVC